MNLLIVSHTPHYKRGGELVGWGATLREIDQLTEIFDNVVHIAPLATSAAPASAIRYQSKRVRMRPVKPAGGDGLWSKLSILIQSPAYLIAMLQELTKADVVHVRCPANISLIALLLLTVLPYPRKRWFKYAGNWKPKGNDALSYKFQRWFLRKGWHRGVVTVNGEWPDQQSFVHAFLNPCLHETELEIGRNMVDTRHLTSPVRLIFAGQLNTAKGVGQTLHILARLRELGVNATLDLIGDDDERPHFERLARSLGVANEATFHGWLPRDALGKLFSGVHFIVLPSRSEGWPKVLSEAMAYGVVPLASNVSSIPQYLERFDCGRTLASTDINSFAETIVWYTKHPEEWKRESENGQRAAELFSYKSYLAAVEKLLTLPRATCSEDRGEADPLLMPSLPPAGRVR